MPAGDMTQRFLADSSGAALLEFTIVMWLFFLTIFGVVEFGYYFWQYGAVTKGGYAAVRYAVVTDPVTSACGTLLPNSGNVITCRGSAGGFSATCTAGTANTTAMDAIIARMRNFAPFVQPQNVAVEYRANAIGMSGSFAPTVTVRIENLQFTTIFLGYLGGRSLPSLDYTMTAEDLNSSAPSGSTLNACGLNS